MKINDAVDLVVAAMKAKKRLMMIGAPGIGKTHAHMEACERLGWDYIGLCSAIEDPSTIRGYPVRDNGGATHCLFDGIYKAFHADKPTLLVFDDLGEATESTMKAILRLIQFGEIDGRKLPDHVVIHAASNDVTHGAGVYGMIEPLKTRFHSIISVETDVESVVQYGLAGDWDTAVLAFLRNAPDSLHDWKPSKTMHVEGATPRGWEYVSQWIKCGVDDKEVIGGCVGKGNAVKFLAFRELQNELPDVDAVMLDPSGAVVPENPSARYLICMALASRMNCTNFGQILKYTKRMPQMFRALSVRDAIEAESVNRKMNRLKNDYKPISSSRDFIPWANSEDGKAICLATS
jgi:hypothetical protein